MDLEQLKHTWQQLDPSPTEQTDLSGVLQKAVASSEGSIRRMKRNVILQSATMLIVFALAYTRIYGRFRLPVGILYGLTIGIFSIYYRKKYLLLKSMERAGRNEDMRTCLSGRLATLRRYLRFYSVTSVLALPVALIFIVVVRWYYQRPYFYSFLGHRFHPGQELLVLACWAICTVALTVPCIYLSRWHIHRRYGRYIGLLEEDLRELEEKE
jgi:hypothetical protein